MQNDDSLSLNVQRPKEEQQKLASVLQDYQLQYTLEQHRITLFMHINQAYLSNLISQKETPKVSEIDKSRWGKGCILLKHFQLENSEIFPNRHEHVQPKLKGNIHLIYSPYLGYYINLHLGPNFIQPADYLSVSLNYQVSPNEWKRKSMTMTMDKENYDVWQLNLDDKDFALYSKPHLLLEFKIIKGLVPSSEFVGINNQGNTCYMNSILQILFFLRPFRKIIVESDNESRLVRCLKNLFVEMLDSDSKIRNVDAEDVIKGIGLFDEIPRRQQDIHEFIIAFFERTPNLMQVISGEFPEVKEFWSGRGIYTTKSKDENKPYESRQIDEFNELDIHMQDTHGNFQTSIMDSLRLLLQQEKVDELIDTPEHGKVEVSKRRTFEELPNIVFLNIKRYEYSVKRNSSKKILSNIEYPEQMDLGFLLGTPTGEDHQYVLYAVTVHKGTTPSSGHYYSLINSSEMAGDPQWFEFNDSFVRAASAKKALSYSGCKTKEITLDKEYRRFVEREIPSDETAYLLVYIRKHIFQEYQSLKVLIPKQYLQAKMKKKREQESALFMEIQVHVFENQASFDPFADHLENIKLTLKADEPLEKQLVDIEKLYLTCRVGSIWKVNLSSKKIMCISFGNGTKDTVAKVFQYRQGLKNANYILVFPYDKTWADVNTQLPQSLGLVRVCCQDTPTEEKESGTGSLEANDNLQSYHIIEKESLNTFLSSLESIKEKKVIIEGNQDEFHLDYNDFISAKLVN